MEESSELGARSLNLHFLIVHKTETRHIIQISIFELSTEEGTLQTAITSKSNFIFISGDFSPIFKMKPVFLVKIQWFERSDAVINELCVH